MFAEDPQQYAHFAEVFNTIKELSIIKNYYQADLFNIEEILSIIDMSEHLEGRRLGDVFKKYIADVIKYYTPEIEPHDLGKLPGNWNDWAFGINRNWYPFASFIASVLNLRLAKVWETTGLNYSDIAATVNQNPQARYSIITLNYDLVAEKACRFIHHNYAHSTTTPALLFTDKAELNDLSPALAKLHGCIDKGNIVPPTWNKGNNHEILPAWKLAYELLTQANHIRIIGYSLPVADTYVKYLFKSAVVANEHLKMIDVVCLDPDGSVRTRYDEFIRFQYYRFFNRSTEEYLQFVMRESEGNRTEKTFDKLEASHRNFASNYPTDNRK